MINVLVVEDDPDMRHLLRRVLDAAGGIEVVGEAKNGSQALALVQSLRPDVVIMDVFMPEMDGLEAMEQLHELCEEPARVLICSVVATPGLVKDAWRKGARGYVLKQMVLDELVDAIVAVSQDRHYFSAGIGRLPDQ
jgi:DNA-binding NarL/FixJ family response regulator